MTPLQVLIAVMVLLTFSALSADEQINPTAPQAPRPNIVWLVSEDHSVHYLKLFSEHGAETPHIELLAEHGLTFNHAFSNASVCSVARTTLATGCYGPRIGTQFHRRSVEFPMPDGLKMFPEYLIEAGYYTANNNKTDYNATAGKNVWNDSSKKATWRNRKADQPFFYMQSFPASHESSLHFTAKQMASEKTLHDPDQVFVAPYHPDTPTFRYTYARYLDRMKQMDEQVGAVVEELTKDGMLEDTFIFYFGDHSGVLPRGKGYAYESGLHFPLVVRIPEKWRHMIDREPGSRVNGFVSFIDLGPTALNLAGVAVPTLMDGKPFFGSGIKHAEADTRDEAFGCADLFVEKYDLVRTLRKGRYEYVRNFQPFNFDGLQNNYRYEMLAYQEWRTLYEAGRLNAVQQQFFEARPAEQLFDIDMDPYETQNLADDPQFADAFLDMRNRLTSRVKNMPDLSLYPESVLAEVAVKNPVQFGQEHLSKIGELVDVSNLSLLPFDGARSGIESALRSHDAMTRYWALIVCSSHVAAAREFIPATQKLAADDNNGLVRVRAAEFLGLIGAAERQAVIVDALKKSTSALEAGLILNTVTLLQDGKSRYKFAIDKSMFSPTMRKNDTIQRRLEYLSP